MKIVVVGTGYVALSTAVSLAKLGHSVTCVDDNEETIDALSNAIVTINEQGLSEMLARFIKEGYLKFTTNLEESLQDAEILISAIVTPTSKPYGGADNTPILKLAEKIGDYIITPILYISVSTIPLGTTRQVKTIVEDKLLNRDIQVDFNVASMPEFLREGVAIESFFNPSKIVVGSDNQDSCRTIIKLLSPVIKENTPILRVSLEEAELIKLASNMLVAARISYMNTIAAVCDKVGAEYRHIHNAIFGSAMPIYAGTGYSGGCFPKDIRTLISGVEELAADATMIKAVEEFNQNHKLYLYQKLKKYYSNNLCGKQVAIWGLSTKRGSSDVDNTPSIAIANQLLQEECKVIVYDDRVSHKFIEQFSDKNIKAVNEKYEALDSSDALIIITDADEFKNADLHKVRTQMKTPLVLDAKNLFNNRNIEEAGIIYYRLFNIN